MGYDYSIQFKRGNENDKAAALSRVVEFQLLAISIARANWCNTLEDDVVNDLFYIKLETSLPFSCFKHEGIWYKTRRLFLSPNSSLFPTIMKRLIQRLLVDILATIKHESSQNLFYTTWNAIIDQEVHPRMQNLPMLQIK